MSKALSLFRSKLAWFISMLIMLFIFIDYVFYKSMICFEIPNEIIDIQTPSALYCKLDYLKRFEGKKIVLIGDSVIYGGAMGEKGDKAWRKHTLSTHLQNLFSQRWKQKEPVLVMNLGMNGALPTDLEYCVKLLEPIKIDILICDVTLRSFSNDFSGEKERFSRPWLQQIAIDAAGNYNFIYEGNNLFSYMENKLRNFLINYSALYRYRDYIQWYLLDAEPAQALKLLRDQLNHYLLKAPDAAQDPMFLILSAKHRYASVNFSKTNPQRIAFERFIDLLAKRGQKTIIFYAQEDKKKIYNITKANFHQKLLDELGDIIKDVSSENITYLPYIADLSSENYIDYVHLNNEGYKTIAEKLFFETFEKIGGSVQSISTEAAQAHLN